MEILNTLPWNCLARTCKMHLTVVIFQLSIVRTLACTGPRLTLRFTNQNVHGYNILWESILSNALVIIIEDSWCQAQRLLQTDCQNLFDFNIRLVSEVGSLKYYFEDPSYDIDVHFATEFVRKTIWPPLEMTNERNAKCSPGRHFHRFFHPTSKRFWRAWNNVVWFDENPVSCSLLGNNHTGSRENNSSLIKVWTNDAPWEYSFLTIAMFLQAVSSFWLFINFTFKNPGTKISVIQNK